VAISGNALRPDPATADHRRMRLTFVRLPDHHRGSALVERDDGVRYLMDGGPVTAALPHDLVHFTVERALDIPDGIWGAVAAGVVFRSMRHHSGRRLPHAAQRSAALIRAHRDRLQRAELIGGVVERVAAMPEPSADRIARLGKVFLASLAEGDVDLRRVPAAAEAVRDMGRRWRALAVGDELTVEWPARLHLPATPPERARRRRDSNPVRGAARGAGRTATRERPIRDSSRRR
jgi:hypothetical protein